MAEDMLAFQERVQEPCTTLLFEEDARECTSIPDQSVDLVITSPPYPNNFDYADATRLEMTFLGEVEGWGDLRRAVSDRLIRSCSQHMSYYKPETALEDSILKPIDTELRRVYERLNVARHERTGKKAYDSMIVAYFHDLARVWLALRRVCAPGALVCFVIGDSAPYGVHVPAEEWLGQLALSAGFKSFTFEKLRDRNHRWLNRKHRVPLHEGRLWVEG
jgi:DNA modification methylase